MPPGPLQWRPMTATDLPAVKALADLIHVAYPEDEAVFADRLAHHPPGCFVLQGEGAPPAMSSAIPGSSGSRQR